jgi:hypothetical protein
MVNLTRFGKLQSPRFEHEQIGDHYGPARENVQRRIACATQWATALIVSLFDSSPHLLDCPHRALGSYGEAHRRSTL